jgi:hypothetical protein
LKRCAWYLQPVANRDGDLRRRERCFYGGFIG